MVSEGRVLRSGFTNIKRLFNSIGNNKPSKVGGGNVGYPLCVARGNKPGSGNGKPGSGKPGNGTGGKPGNGSKPSNGNGGKPGFGNKWGNKYQNEDDLIDLLNKWQQEGNKWDNAHTGNKWGNGPVTNNKWGNKWENGPVDGEVVNNKCGNKWGNKNKKNLFDV